VAACSLVSAQTAPPPAAKTPKSAVKPAAKAPETNTLSLGAGVSGGPLLSRNELRACLGDQDSIRSRRAELEAGRAPLEQEKQAIAAETETLAGERASIDEIAKKIDALNARLKAHTQHVDDWNQRFADHEKDMRGGLQWERRGKELNREHDAIVKEREELEAESTRMASVSELARTYNERALKLGTRVTVWNQRNARSVADFGDLEDERKAWVSRCGDRRYREDDELAIRRGK
jgi:chromosome segregation ATPase